MSWFEALGCILGSFCLLSLLIFLIRANNAKDVINTSTDVDRGETLSSIKSKYINAYEWVVKNLGVDTNAISKWEKLSEEKKNERFEYDLCYCVSRYGHYLPKNFPKMKNEVTNGEMYDCHNSRKFMIEFIEVVEGIKKDYELVDLCDQYKIPVDFGVIGAKREYERRYLRVDTKTKDAERFLRVASKLHNREPYPL